MHSRTTAISIPNGHSSVVCTLGDHGSWIANITFFCFLIIKVKVSNSCRGLDRSRAFQEVEAPKFQDNRHLKVVRLSAVCTGLLYPPGNIPGTHLCYRLSRPQGHSAAGRIVNEKLQWHHRKSNLRPFDLQHSGSTNCATACPTLTITVPILKVSS
jgi:hypothetical protein